MALITVFKDEKRKSFIVEEIFFSKSDWGELPYDIMPGEKISRNNLQRLMKVRGISVKVGIKECS